MSASNRAAPSAAVAPVGSPSTPLGATAATPPRRSSPISSAEGRGGAGLGPVEADAPGVEGEQQRGLGAAGVGVAAGHRRRPGEDPAALVDEQGGGRGRTASRLPPWPFTNTTPAKASAERPSSTSTVASASVPIERVPAKPACSPDGAVGDGRGGDDVGPGVGQGGDEGDRDAGVGVERAGGGRAARRSRGARPARPGRGRPPPATSTPPVHRSPAHGPTPPPPSGSVRRLWRTS